MVRIPGNRDPRWFLSLVLSFVLMAGTGNAWDVLSLSHQGYRLGANDVVKVQVFGEEDLTVERKIEGDGNINFPLLGAVQVAGKTIPELQGYLRSQSGARYVRKPKVTAFVVRH